MSYQNSEEEEKVAGEISIYRIDEGLEWGEWLCLKFIRPAYP